jgi:hypothetical protein
MPPLLNMIARVGNDLCPLGLRNEWLSPCAASTLPSVGLEICASCATRGTCIRTHLLPTACREVAITSFGDHPNASITHSIAGCVPFFILIQSGERGLPDTADSGERKDPAALRRGQVREKAAHRQRPFSQSWDLKDFQRSRGEVGQGIGTFFDNW